MTDHRRHAPATARNRDPILAVLRDVLPATGTVLEIASGTGEHAAYFARALPGIIWQPSDPSAEALSSIRAWAEAERLDNLRPPLLLDASASVWPGCDPDKQTDYAACLCINMVHISAWAATLGLFKGGAKVLQAGAPLILYGPYIEDDVATAPSNLAFDRSLKERNPDWGLRNLADVDKVAAEHGFARIGRVEMPANNLTLIYRKAG